MISITTYESEVCQIKEKYWLWKWTFGVDQQEHVEEESLEIK
jgi:hypothetical protein